MLKRIWAYYENLDYRVLAEKLDEMARAGWRLKHLGLLGPIFEDCAPDKTVYHRVIRSPQISGEPIPAGWTFLLRSGQRTVITRDAPLTPAEKLVEDQENDHYYRGQKHIFFCWLFMVIVLVWSDLRTLDRSVFLPEGLLFWGTIICWVLLLAEGLLELANALAYRRARRAGQPYEPVVAWRRLQLFGWLALAVCFGGTMLVCSLYILL